VLRQVTIGLESQTEVQEVARAHGARVSVLDCKDLNKKDMAFLLDVSVPHGDAEEVISDLKTKKVFKRIYAGETKEQPSRSLCVAILNRPAVCQAVKDCGAFCLNCPYSSSEGNSEWNLLVRDSEQLKALLTELEDHHINASIGGLSDVRREEELTARQIEVLTKAISLGYFEFPRRFSLTALSQELGIKPSTLSQVLRAAEEKVMCKYAADMKIARVTSPSRNHFSF